jgi:DNA-binding transcriptional ArsR family regulator
MSQPTPSKSDPEPPRDRADPHHTRTTDEVEEESEGKELRTLCLDSDDAGELISSLSSDTARSIVIQLHETPSTASELGDAVGTSVQNVRHHLENLEESGLVEVADTRYSSKGREMDVYAPVDEPMVVFVGREERSGFVDSLKRFVGAIGVLGLGSLLVQWLAVGSLGAGSSGVPRVSESVGNGAVSPFGVQPGLLFFAGGALVLALVSAWRYYRRNDGVVDPVATE